MKIFRLLKRFFFFQDLLSFLKTRVPPAFVHNWEKYRAIQKAFYLTALENLDGDYLEFGIFTGSSFVCALRSHRQMRTYGDAQTRFFGYDSFSGFGEVEKGSEHPFYTDETFTINEKKVRRFIRRRSGGLDVQIVKGFFKESLKGSCKKHGIKKIRIAFIDCDLKEPALQSLEYMKDGLQKGTILIMDDFFSYKGSQKKGIAGAFNAFLKKHRKLEVRQLFTYGALGTAYIFTDV